MIKNILSEIITLTKRELNSYDFSKLNNYGIKKNSGGFKCFYPGLETAKEYNPKKNNLKTNNKKIDLYVHIPYCSRKCNFCKYYTDTKKTNYKELINSILTEIKYYKKFDYIIGAINIGGGSASQLETKDLKLILNTIQNNFKLDKYVQKCIEVHPELIRDKKYNDFIDTLVKFGFKDISLGIQTFDDNILKKYNRGHTSQDSINFIKKTKQKLPNIRIDLLYGLENQDLKTWITDILKSIKLDIYDISAYMFIKNKKYSNTTEKKLIFMKLLFINIMKHFKYNIAGGFQATEFKFRKIKTNRHTGIKNLKIIGIGPSAYSTTTKYNAMNEMNIKGYIKKVNVQKNGVQLINKFTKEDFLIKTIIDTILFDSKINILQFNKLFNIDFEEKFSKQIELIIKLKLGIVNENKILILTKKGIIYNDEIINFFIPTSFYKAFYNFKNNEKILPKLRKYILNSPFQWNLNKRQYKIIKKNES